MRAREGTPEVLSLGVNPKATKTLLVLCLEIESKIFLPFKKKKMN